MASFAFWIAHSWFAPLTDEDLDRWAEHGIGAFAVVTHRLPGMGETAAWRTSKQQIEESKLVARCADRGIDVYPVCYLANPQSPDAPLAPWVDDAKWNTALATLETFASEAKRMGCKGIGFDCEPYQISSSAWVASASGTHAKARQRGGQVMQALSRGFPGLELMVYYFKFPGSYEAEWRSVVQGFNVANQLHGDFWQGAADQPGYGRIEFWDSFFYKSIPAAGDLGKYRGDWDGAFAEATRRHHAFFQGYDKVFYTPFAWLSDNPATATSWDNATPLAQAREQLTAALKHGTAGVAPIYGQRGFAFDYTPYLELLKELSDASEQEPEPEPEPEPTDPTDVLKARIVELERNRDAIRAERDEAYSTLSLLTNRMASAVGDIERALATLRDSGS